MNVFAGFEHSDGGKSLYPVPGRFIRTRPSELGLCPFIPRCARRTRRDHTLARRSNYSLRAVRLGPLSSSPTTLPQLRFTVSRFPRSQACCELSKVFAASSAGALQEVFGDGTAADVTPTALIGSQSPRPSTKASMEAEVVEIVLPLAGGPGSLA